MGEACLWGNATDLSLLTSLTYADVQKLQGAEARRAAERNVLVNDLGAAFDVLDEARRDERGQRDRRVDIVLDNAGFELFVDLVLAGYMLAAGLATTVVLHPKSIPWFVSDVVPADFVALLNALGDPRKFFNARDDGHAAGGENGGDEWDPLAEQLRSMDYLFTHWQELHAEGRLILRPNRFWTEGGSFWRMPERAPALFEDLKESELVIFKGDLNYRKLTADVRLFPPCFGHAAVSFLQSMLSCRCLS